MAWLRLSKKIIKTTLLSAILLLVNFMAFGGSNDPRFALLGEETEPPSGYYDFCMEHLKLCDNEDRKPEDIYLTSDKYSKLTALNAEFNGQITQVSDAKHYGKHEYWTIPSGGRGDREDISILKRLKMVKAGFTIQSLLLTQVMAPKEGSHIVLTIKTDQSGYRR